MNVKEGLANVDLHFIEQQVKIYLFFRLPKCSYQKKDSRNPKEEVETCKLIIFESIKSE